MDSNGLRIYTEHDHNKWISLAPKDKFDVLLAENRTTGFRWHLLEWDHSVLELEHDEFFPSKPVQPGSSGQHAWRFIAQKLGLIDLEFVYKRSWEQTTSIKNFLLHVSVI